MTFHERIFTSESVTPGHPDKLCDQISDAAVDAYLQQDANASIEVECAIATGILFIATRFAAQASVDVPVLARKVIADAGYRGGDADGFDARSCSILTSFTEIEREAASSAVAADPAGVPAREQVNAFGFACDETTALMPLPIVLAHRLARALAAASLACDWLSPDGKTQVAVEYREGRPQRVRAVTITTALRGSQPSPRTIQEVVRERIVGEAFAGETIVPDAGTAIHFNPGGPYLVGGPARHSGLTGRKTGIDTYGEYARQSGAALSGKDPSRIDRVGAYAARYAAKNIVAARLATRCEVHLAYAIGVVEPLSVYVDTFGTGRMNDAEIAQHLSNVIDFRPAAIDHRFGLRELAHRSAAGGFFRRLAVYGQVGRTDLPLPWERIDVAKALAE